MVFTNPEIEQAVCRAAVVARNVATGIEKGEIGDAAKIQNGAGFVCVAEQVAMQQGSQRGALTACLDVRLAEMANGGRTGAASDNPGAAQLNRSRRISVRVVPNGLAMRSDGRDIAHLDPGLLSHGPSGPGEMASEEFIQHAALGRRADFTCQRRESFTN